MLIVRVCNAGRRDESEWGPSTTDQTRRKSAVPGPKVADSVAPN